MADLDSYLENIGISSAQDDSDEPATFPTPELAAQPGQPPLIAEVAQVTQLEGDTRQRCEQFLIEALRKVGPSYGVEVTQEKSAEHIQLHAEIRGGEIGRLIGKNGRTLAALEYLSYCVLNNNQGEQHVRVSVDVGGYKARQHDKLRHIASQAADRARKTGLAVELEPMAPAERRIVHMVIAEELEVESASVGEGRARRVVVRCT